MKKILISILITFIGICAEAQHWIGIRGAYNNSDITIDRFNYRRTNSYSSMNYGLIYKLYIDKYTGIQAELNNIKRGFSYRENDTINIRESWELPVLGHGRLEFGNFIGFLNGGFYIGYTQKAKYKIKSETSSNEIPVSFNDRDVRFEFGFGFGGGIGFRIAKRMELQTEFRYNYGLTYLYKPKYKSERIKYIQPVSMQVSFGILYKFANIKK
ncbi:MAG: PorT family protein [Prevotellaceae bacterium]|jgi:opacity protein-like surface antigen|nr:PorT family protein [Prevotellaceae bacterium]